MNLKLVSLGIAAAVGFAACATTDNTNVNRVTNGNANNAVVVNSNQAPITGNSNANTATNANRSSINYNGTAKENESQRGSVEAQAKSAGDTIGKGLEDWWIYGKVRAALATNTNLSSSTTFKVDVADNAVTLTGDVAKQTDVTEADKTVKGVSGVTKVVNKLKVNPNASTLGGSNSNAANTNRK